MESARNLAPSSGQKLQPKRGIYQAPAIIYEGEITVRAGTQIDFNPNKAPNQGSAFSIPDD